jgi:Arc/MetJ-type ribon-helix-helix transcriptional regulator
MATLTFSLPDDLREVIEARVAAGIYPDAGSYIRDLIDADLRANGFEASDELIAALEEGEASGWSDKTPRQIIAEERAKFRSS